MVHKTVFAFCSLVSSVILAACAAAQSSPTPQPDLPNPASVYCEENGGRVDLRKDESGAVAGVCVFPDGSECEEWAYFRKECLPVGALPRLEPTASAAAEQSGQIVFYSDRDGGNSIYLLDIDNSSLTHLTPDTANAFSGPFSPDGTHLLFTGFGLTHSYVGVMNADGSGQTDLTNRPESDEGFPAWSPDGQQIAFTSRRDGNNEIYMMNADGSHPKRLTNSPTDDFAPAWAPDGLQIAFVSDRDNPAGVYSIYIMNADGSGVKRLTNDKGSDYTPAWSLDGSQIAFRSVQGGQSDIYLIWADGSNMTNLTDNPAEDWSPAWSPDGKRIAFQSDRDGNWEIYSMNADGSDPVNLTSDPADDQLPYWKP